MNTILEQLPNLFEGLKYTLFIFTLTLSLSLPLGVIVALGRLSPIPFLRPFFTFFIYVMRGTPLLLQIIFIYYGLPAIGIVFERIPAVLLAFSLNYAAYFGEIYRGGIQSVDKEQYEAAFVTGLSKWNTFRLIVLPQVIKKTIPSISNEVITLIKDTALVYVVGIGELLRASKIAANRDASLLPFLLAGVIYLIVTFMITKVLERIERRYNYYE